MNYTWTDFQRQENTDYGDTGVWLMVWRRGKCTHNLLTTSRIERTRREDCLFIGAKKGDKVYTQSYGRDGLPAIGQYLFTV